jgi:hypothetical protein
MAMLKKHVAAGKGSPQQGKPVCSVEFESYPFLWEFLFLTVWDEDGSSRETGTVLLFCDGPHLKVMLNDKDSSRVAFSTLDPDVPCLEAIDAVIGAAGTDWRPSRPSPKGK